MKQIDKIAKIICFFVDIMLILLFLTLQGLEK